MRHLSHYRSHAPIAALAILGAPVAIIAVIYGRFLAHPSRYFVGDLVSFYQPFRAHVAACLRQGELPLWTPAVFAGSPTLADAQLGLFYPPNLIHLWVGFPGSELALFLMHLVWAGLGMVVLSRRLGAGYASALVGGLATAGSGFFLAHAVHPNFVHTAAWVPWLLAATHRLTTRPRPGALGLTALCVGLTVLSGGLQVAYLGLGLALLLGLAWALTLPDLDHRTRLLGTLGVLLAVGLGLALAAVQLLPTAELAPLSVRAHGVTLELARGYRLTTRQALHLVAPFAFGLPGRAPYVGGQSFWEAFGYVGVVTLPLALTAVAPGRRPWRAQFTRWVLALTALLALLVAMGPESPMDLHRLAWTYLPGFDRFRAPGRLLYLVDLALVILAALGAQDLLDAISPAPSRRTLAPPPPPDERSARTLTRFSIATALVLGALGAALLLAGSASPLLPPKTAHLARGSAVTGLALLGALWLLVRIAPGHGAPRWAVAGGMLALLALDLSLAGRPVAAALQPPRGTDVARRAHRPPPAIHASLARPARSYRVLYRPDSYFMLQNAGLLHGYDNLRAYSPVLLRRTWDLLSLADRGHFARWRRLPMDHNHNFLRNVRSPIARLLGVKWVLSHDRGGRPGVRRDLRWRVRTLPRPLPRAFLVYRTRLATTRHRAEQLMRHLRPAEEAVVASRDGLLPRPTTTAQPPSDGQGQATAAVLQPPTASPTGQGQATAAVLQPPTASPTGQGQATAAVLQRRSACTGRALLSVSARAPALLVFTEADYPGWRARVDGRPAPVVRADHALLGVVVPAGAHQVELVFRPTSLRIGAAVSGTTFAFLILLWLWPLRRRWRRGKHRAP